jgi:CBS domain-containing protein
LIELLLNRQLNEEILFPCGSAMPHLHIENFQDTDISVLVPEKPIQTEYGVIKIIFMVFTCKSDNTLYLQILNSIVRLSKDNELFNKVLSCKTAKDFVKTLKRNDLPVKKAFTVGDIMTLKVLTVKRDTTLKELGHQFYTNNFGYFIVIDDDNKPIGEVTILDYLMAGLPDYTKFLNNLHFLRTLDPFERLMSEEEHMYVSSIMKPIEYSVAPNTSIFKTVFLMNKNKKRDIPVIEHGRLVGVVSYTDIFRKVIKG